MLLVEFFHVHYVVFVLAMQMPVQIEHFCKSLTAMITLENTSSGRLMRLLIWRARSSQQMRLPMLHVMTQIAEGFFAIFAFESELDRVDRMQMPHVVDLFGKL